MALIEYTLDGKIDKVKKAVNRILCYADLVEYLTGNPKYFVAYSDGKDSDVVRILCQLANVQHELVHNHTTVDAPETVYYIRSIPNIKINKPNTTMWDLIVKKKMPPTALCDIVAGNLKRSAGKID